jgi:hypothetical protein
MTKVSNDIRDLWQTRLTTVFTDNFANVLKTNQPTNKPTNPTQTNKQTNKQTNNQPTNQPTNRMPSVLELKNFINRILPRQ